MAFPGDYTVQPHQDYLISAGIYALNTYTLRALALLGMPLITQPGFGSTLVSTSNNPDTTLLQAVVAAVIHKVTLQDLLRYRNDAVHRLLLECNKLLCKQ
jgi:hypothetical protein